ncbi:deoxynucleoside triphosphate triphosphohydrolase SAMHD1-like [Littorina saxatilis]|uniref:deoxynucleoside triphosphate triphosphohydrolase SAMHD1-like n=1 Tax=Littorina saxatilis TaxID=31220 RepID=UPI0038B50EBB
MASPPKKAKVTVNKVFNDPVHGHLELPPLCVAIIDTPQFQRLRFLKQLGGVYFVYPGAAHNRFEHCLGVCHLAGKLTRALKDRQQDLGITEADILCVQIAGLCHDLGHGPFSHVFDKDVVTRIRPDIIWKHEDASAHLFRYMVETNNLDGVFKEHGVNTDDYDFILKLISGERPKSSNRHLRSDKAFLYDIVANERSGVDVDKWDYLKRDCHQLGIPSSFDHTRFIQFARVIGVKENKDDLQQICFRDKEAYDMYEMFHTRFALHRKAYQHKVVQSVQLMLVEAMVEAEKFIIILGNDKKRRFKISECIDQDKMDAYTNLTDEIFHQILQSNNPKAHKAKELLNDIMKRKLYKCVKESVPIADKATTSKTVVEIKQEILDKITGKPEIKQELKTSRFVVQVVQLDYGKKFQNPVDFVRFYHKDKQDEALALDALKVSHLIPNTTFKEEIIRLFFRPSDDDEKDSECTRLLVEGFREWCRANNMQVPDDPVASPAAIASTSK